MTDTDFVKIAKALADPTRHRILREVRAAGELTCKQVCERFALSQPTISHHICTLAEAGLFKVRKRGQFHVLTVDHAVLDGFVAFLGSDGADAPPASRPARSRLKRAGKKS
ncbi:MAG: ArsR/SmtB family transcription factor [Phycisphaerales bacterium]